MLLPPSPACERYSLPPAKYIFSAIAPTIQGAINPAATKNIAAMSQSLLSARTVAYGCCASFMPTQYTRIACAAKLIMAAPRY